MVRFLSNHSSSPLKKHITKMRVCESKTAILTLSLWEKRTDREEGIC